MAVYINLRNPTLNVMLITINDNINKPPISIYEIFSFIIPTLLTFVQMRYPDEDPFQTHPVTLNILVVSLIAYCLASGVRRRYLVTFAPWFHMAMMLFGSCSVASLFWLLFPSATWQPLLWGLIIAGRVLPGFVVKFWEWFRRFLRRVRARQSRLRTTSPVLPVTLLTSVDEDAAESADSSI